jgi:hypothetical protein
MFQPQPTPFAPFSTYGVTSPILTSDFSAFQIQPTVGLVVDSGGPTAFRDPIFSPVASNNYNNSNNSHNYIKMQSNDLDAQEALARDFQPSLEAS